MEENDTNTNFWPSPEKLHNGTVVKNEAEDNSENEKIPDEPQFYNGHRLPKPMRAQFSKQWTGIPLKEIDPHYKEKKTFIVIGRGSQILYRFGNEEMYTRKTGGWKGQAISILTHGVFNLFMTFTILLNCLLLILFGTTIFQSNKGEKYGYNSGNSTPYDDNGKLLLQLTNVVFLTVYILEFVIKVLARGLYDARNKFSCLRISWSWLDIFVILTGIVITPQSSSTFLISLVGLRALKLIPLVPGILETHDILIKKIFGKIFHVLFYILLSFFMLAIAGLNLFMGSSVGVCVPNVGTSQNETTLADTDEDLDYTDPIVYEDLLCGDGTFYRSCQKSFKCQFFENYQRDRFTSFDNFFLSLLQVWNLSFQDYAEAVFVKVLNYTNVLSMLYFFIVFFFGTFFIGTLIYSIIVKELRKNCDKVIHREKSSTKSCDEVSVPQQHCTGSKCLRTIVDHEYFEFLITLNIIIDIINMALEGSSSRFGELIAIVTTLVYLLEAVMKILGHGKNYFVNKWNLFDFAIATLLSFQWFVATANVLVILNFRSFKLIPRWPTLNFMFQVTWIVLFQALQNIFGVSLITMFIAAIFGLTNFRELYFENVLEFPKQKLPRWNMTDFWNSIYSLLRILCGENVEIFWELYSVSSAFTSVLVICFFIIVPLVLILFVKTIGIGIILTTTKLLSETKPVTGKQKNILLSKLFFPLIWIEHKIMDYFSMPWNGSNQEETIQLTETNETTDASSPQIKKANNEVEVAESQTDKKEAKELSITFLRVIEHWLFQAVVVFIITVASALLAFPVASWHIPMEWIFIIFISCEIILKFIALKCPKKMLNLAFVLDLLVLCDSLITLIFFHFDVADNRELLFFSHLRPMMLISRCERLKIVVTMLTVQFCSITKYLFATLFIWLTFSTVGVSLYNTMFYECFDQEGMYKSVVISGKMDCIMKNLTWQNSPNNFDNSVNGMYSLLLLGFRNGWIQVIQNAEDSTDYVDLIPVIKNNPWAHFQAFIFIVIGVFIPISIIFGVLVHRFTSSKNWIENFATPAQLKLYSERKHDKENENEKEIGSSKHGLIEKIVSNPHFETGICLLIVVDFILFAIQYKGQSDFTVHFVRNSQLGILILYIFEAVLKIIVWRGQYFKTHLNRFDFFVVISSIFDVIFTEFAETLFLSFGLLRIFRILRIFKLKIFNWMHKNEFHSYRKALSRCLPVLRNLLNIYVIMFFTFTIYGRKCFHNTRSSSDTRVYFENFSSALVSVFQLSTISGWNTVYSNGIGVSVDCEIRDPVTNYPGTCGMPILGFIYCLVVTGITIFIWSNIYITLVIEVVEEMELEDLNTDTGKEHRAKPHESYNLDNNGFTRKNETIAIESEVVLLNSQKMNNGSNDSEA